MTSILQAAQFLKSVAALSQLPADDGREVAFAGRSNAGKSSALNVLTGHKGLARTSKTPGRTQLLNYFTVSPQCYLVDLPGYGYAKVPAAVRRDWGELVGGYLQQRLALKGLILIMDIRHPFTDFDLQLLDWCQAEELPVHILLSKADKLSRGAASQTLQAARVLLGRDYPAAQMSVQVFSALKKLGVDEARHCVTRWLGLDQV
ncbi:MAG: YihA family ribosome biogenesis GTP-binding protein [Gammaproteobacteria bacterium]|nr:YihA family ribosome biogenesis GTP-binding protein [Gammaproteobacteria bacterium]